MQILGPISSRIKVAHKSYLYFGGTAYLGIPQHLGFRELYVEGLAKFGLNNGTSRSNNIQLGIYDEAEEFASVYFGAQACLITSSGYLAAQLAISHLSTLGEVRYAPATHPALWTNEVPAITGSFQDWAIAVVKEINQSKINDWVIISNSLNNLYPEIYNFSFVEQINKEKKVILIVDDSHGIGVTTNGKGVFSTLPTAENVETVVLASMAKALGVDAGLILGSKPIISLLKQSHEFLGASPPSAAGLFAFMNASSFYEEEQAKLKKLMDLFVEALKSDDRWVYTFDLPVFLSKAAKIEKKLIEQGILISSFAYPDKNGSLINRIVLSSWHTHSDIEELILALQKTSL